MREERKQKWLDLTVQPIAQLTLIVTYGADELLQPPAPALLLSDVILMLGHIRRHLTHEGIAPAQQPLPRQLIVISRVPYSPRLATASPPPTSDIATRAAAIVFARAAALPRPPPHPHRATTCP